MIAGLALGADGTVYSVIRERGASHVVQHAPDEARSLYSTKDALCGLWVSPRGAIHAAGARHHTDRSGAWKAAKTGAGEAMVLWGASEDELFLGTEDGEVMRFIDGAWTELAAGYDLVCGIAGTNAADVWIGGDGMLCRFDGTALHDQPLPQGESMIQAVYCDGRDVWMCGTTTLYRNGEPVARLDAKNSDELYAIGIGKDGVFAQGPAEVYGVDGARLVAVDGLERAALGARGAYSTCMVGNGTRVVAGGVRSVLVNDGASFVEWPGLRAKRRKK